jgi:hypothetical protein
MTDEQIRELMHEIKMLNRNVWFTASFVQVAIAVAFIIVAIKW